MKYMFNLYHFSNKKNLLVFIVILLTGFLLRAIGADWGFPYFFHPDENHIPFSSYSLFANHSLDPHFYSWPSHLSIYLNSLLYSVFSYLVFHKSIVLTFAEHKFTYFEYSRIVTALLGTFTIVISYLIGKEFSVKTGLFCALIVCIFPLYVEHSHYITPDIILTLLLSIVMLFFIKYSTTGLRTYALLASVFIALAVSEKYPGLILSPILLLLIIMVKKNSNKIRIELLLCSLTFIGTLLLISPYLFIHCDHVLHALHHESRTYHLGAGGLGYIGNMIFYERTGLNNLGTIGAVLMFTGLFFVFKNEKPVKILALFSGFFYWIVLSHVPLHWERWSLPMYITPIILIAYALDQIYCSSFFPP